VLHPGWVVYFRVDLLYLVAKVLLMGGDLEELCCHLHRPMNYI
jgi:hypothetical protein